MIPDPETLARTALAGWSDQPVESITPDTDLRDLNIDSLDRLELLLLIEE